MQNEKENQKGSLSWSTPAPTQPSLTGPKAAVASPKMVAKASPIGAYAGILVGGIIIGVLLSWGWTATRSTAPVANKAATSTVADDNSTALAPSGMSVDADGQMQMNSSLVVDSPQAAGDNVTIASVSVEKPTWVVVYEENGGKPGNALGALLVDTSTKDATVSLLRDTTPGEQYLVGESIDDGSHVFSLKDSQVTENGQTLWVAFTAQ